jgi:hypothetical protein
LLRPADGTKEIEKLKEVPVKWRVNLVKDINVKYAARKYCALKPVKAL